MVSAKWATLGKQDWRCGMNQTLLNLSISLRAGKENKYDSPSSGERRGISSAPNLKWMNHSIEEITLSKCRVNVLNLRLWKGEFIFGWAF